MCIRDRTNTISFEQEPANIDDIMETINHFQCFDYMIDSANDILDEDFIKNTHKILKTNTSDSRISWFNVGDYKSRKNMVGDLITTQMCIRDRRWDISKLLWNILCYLTRNYLLL